MGDINPAAVPPFLTTTPTPPTPLMPGGTAQMPQAAGFSTWTYMNGQFINPANGNPGQPGPADIIQLPGGGPGPNGMGIPYSQWVKQGFGQQAGAFQAAQQNAMLGGQGGDFGQSRNMGFEPGQAGTLGAGIGGGPVGGLGAAPGGGPGYGGGGGRMGGLEGM
jgi:hypothetical protein